jgi:hypothetical protein
VSLRHSHTLRLPSRPLPRAALVCALLTLTAISGTPERAVALPNPHGVLRVVGVLGIGAAIVLVVGVLAHLPALRRAPPDERIPEPPPRSRRTLALLLLMLLGLCCAMAVVVVAAGQHSSAHDSAVRATPGERPAARAHTGGDAVSTGAIVALVATAAIAGGTLALRRASRDQVPRRYAEHGGLAEEALLDVRQALVDERDPRRAVIQAYARMREALRDAGVPPLPWEAPREHLARARSLGSTDAEALADLTAEFERARFHDGEVSDASRAQALRALDRILFDLRRPA